MNPQYTLERWLYGWTISSPEHQRGVPMTALNEVMPMFPKKAVMCPDIAHHLKTSGFPRVVICIAKVAMADTWRERIRESLDGLSPQEQWWRGLDVGASSATIFSCFCDSALAGPAREFGRGCVPSDSGDLGRCLGLLEKFPEWRARLDEVASAFSETLWPAMIARWDELEKADPALQSAILEGIRSDRYKGNRP